MNNASFSTVKIVAFDSMCFIYYFEANPKYGQLVKKIFSQVSSSKISAISSVITIAETLTVSLFPTEYEVRTYYKERFLEMKNLKLIDVDLDIAVRAAVIRDSYKLKLGDAIQLATALHNKAQLFVTNDKQFQKIKEIKIMMLDDLL